MAPKDILLLRVKYFLTKIENTGDYYAIEGYYNVIHILISTALNEIRQENRKDESPRGIKTIFNSEKIPTTNTREEIKRET